MGEALTIEARHERGYPIVTVAGEIDIATAARLRERLFELAAAAAAGGRPGPGPLHRFGRALPRWSARPSGPPRTAAACMWSAPGRRSASCSG